VRPFTLLRLERARQDELDAIAYYARDAGLDVALRFRKALRGAYESMIAAPATGSPRYGAILDIDGLRSRKLRGFPYLVFYVLRGNRIDVWRVLHSKRDILAALEPDGS